MSKPAQLTICHFNIITSTTERFNIFKIKKKQKWMCKTLISKPAQLMCNTANIKTSTTESVILLISKPVQPTVIQC